LALYDEAIALAVDVDRTSFAHHADFVRAYIHAASGDTHAALARLRDLLAAGRRDRYMGFMRIPPPLLATMLALALQHGIETDYVRALIRRHRLAPPDLSTPDWPWPLAIQTLGEFALLRDGVPLVSKGKAQKKPLELLKALVAHGGRGVDATMLTTLLWPEAEGDDAKTSFDSNLYRLRKLLDVDGALVLTEGKLSLDASRVAVDTWSLEAALDAGDVTTALRLYRGPFLALDAAPAFALPARDRWQARLVREVLAAGDKLERAGDWPAARAIYERTLEVDNLAEAVYRRLMICQREAGDAAGALVTYRRCRELLSIVLGRVPAPETEAVRQTL
jgi:DNA-binding SARP family transcriptional activator